jgi:AcrR family transcriptional regulator
MPSPAGSRWQERVVDRSLQHAAQQSLDRGRSIIAVATALLARPEADFTVQEVAEGAEMSLRTFYRHFGGKDDLLLALFEEYVVAYAAYLGAEADRFEDPLDRLGAAVHRAVSLPLTTAGDGTSTAVDPGVGVGLCRLHLRLSAGDSAKVSAAQQPVCALFERLVGDAVAAGALPVCDPAAAAYSIVSSTVALLISRTLDDEHGRRLPTPAEHLRFCLRGLGADPTQDWSARLDTIVARRR